ncbi:50S ribosomal protein L23 [Mesomycoplasma bovoculi]|uniref:Large ribosomal subunit protein uL23 n=1 Tax=Mesomycoplasma bovoculi M165/69 TaxID=743966 RepID=W5UT04_9BACT|nr:50S ribosomal protein L23 [Mesomycoplasma bovoculi]AHH45344.1 50S ribosomal protein L23 [Mesomycoplasma bovoculi M165/69]
MNFTEIIKAPILTEKTYEQMPSRVYTFAVDKRTNRSEVKKAIEYIFDVKVEKVNISVVDRKAKKLGRFAGFVPGYKKAYVTLKDGYSIKINDDESPIVEQDPQDLPKDQLSEEQKAEKQARYDEVQAKVAEKLANKAKKTTSKSAESDQKEVKGKE